MPCDWIGIVTIRRDTRCTRSKKGRDQDHARAASLALYLPEPELHSPLILLQDPNRRQSSQGEQPNHDEHGDSDHDSSSAFDRRWSIRDRRIPDGQNAGGQQSRAGSDRSGKHSLR
jgi:hypothetical protein